MNWGSVIKGGLVAGLVMNIGETILNVVILGDAWAEATAGMELNQGGALIAYLVIGGFAIGLICLWLYAAVRPRLGPGPATAWKVGASVWALAFLWPQMSFVLNGLFPANLVLIGLAWSFVEMPLAVVIGAWLYRDRENPAA